MSEEVIEIWKRIKRDNEFTTNNSTTESSTRRCQSCKAEETETKFKVPSIEVLLDNTSRFAVSSVDGYSALSGSTDVRNRSVVSDFGDADCGDSFKPHSLVYDFTKKPGDEEVTLKCSEFWNYVYSRPDLKRYMVHPSVSVSVGVPDTSTTEELNCKENQDQNTCTPASVSNKAVQFLSEGKTPDPLPTMKRIQKYCDIFGSYQDEQDAKERKLELEAISSRGVKSIRSRISAEEPVSRNIKPQSSRVKAICEEMASFDEAHPRNLDPPMVVCLHRLELHKLH